MDDASRMYLVETWMSTAKHATLVLGPHRSGTSAVTGLLVRCGLQPPKTLMPSDERNAAGYFESSVFHEFHERLLKTVGTRWDSYTRIDPNWLQSKTADAWREECRALLRLEFDAATPFVVKDPRICRFVQFWLQVFEEESVAASSVLVLRHPREVAASLAVRDGLPRCVSLLMWLRHVLDAEIATRSMRRGVVAYHDILTDWRSAIERLAKTLGAAWSGSWLAGAAHIDQFIRKELRHHRIEDDDATNTPPLLADWVERTWIAMATLVEGDPQRVSVALEAIDAVRKEFEGAVTVFGVDAEQQLLEASNRISALENLVRERADLLVRERADLLTQIADLDAANNVLADETARLQHERATLEARVGDLAAEATAHQAHVNGLIADLAALQAHATLIEAERTTLRSSMSWRVTAPLRAIFRVLR